MKVIASCPICNTASLNIYTIDEEVVYASINNDNPKKYKLYTSTKGCYFRFAKTRYYLSEFMRTNI